MAQYALQDRFGHDLRQYGATGDGSTDDAAALSAASAGAGSAGAGLIAAPGTYAVESNVTIAAPLTMQPGAILKPANGVTVTLPADFTAGPYRVFDLSAGGAVGFDAPPTRVLPQWFGLATLGVYDTSTIQAAVTAAPDGSLIEVPPVSFTGDEPIAWTGKGLHIDLTGATITYTREQDAETPSYDESLFVLSEADGTSFRGGKLVYNGTFDTGSSYSGFISGIYLNESDDVLIEELEATGFNRAGVSIGVGDGYDYCNRVAVRGSHLHHNRVGGLLYGDTNGLTVDDCDLHFNGLSTDNGTGYGCASWSTKNPIDTKISNSRANDNYRKGIDFHAGQDGAVTNNTTARNKYYGIFVGNVTGVWHISGNTIREMVDDDAQGVYGFHFGPDEAQSGGTAATIAVITGNVFEDLHATDTENSLFVMVLYLGTLQAGSVTISNNTVRVGRVSRLVQVATGSGGGYFDLSMDNNQWSADEVTSSPFAILSALSRKKSFSGNKVSITEELSVANVVAYASSSVTGNAWHAHGNDLTLTSSEDWNADPIMVRRVAQEKLSGNTLNGAPLRDWDGARYVATATAQPSTGFWSAGSYVANTSKSVAGSGGSQYILNGWQRLTTGTGHTGGTDWTEDRGLTGT